MTNKSSTSAPSHENTKQSSQSEADINTSMNNEVLPKGDKSEQDMNDGYGVMLELDYLAPSHVSDVSNVSTNNDSNGSHDDNNTTKHEKSLTQAQVEQQAQHVALFTQLNRPEVSFHARVKAPLVFRDTLLALFDVVSSDYRYVPKDRSAYTVFMQMRRSNANKNLFTAQRDYFNWLFNNDPLAFCILDPIIQVHQDGVSFEVFSRDEGCYAQLTLSNALFDIEKNTDKKGKEKDSNTPIFGTTSIDYSTALYEGITQIRDYQKTVLDIGHEAVSLSHEPLAMASDDSNNLNNLDNLDSLNSLEDTSNSKNTVKKITNDSLNTNDVNSSTEKNQVIEKNKIIEKRINVPKSWIRALLQVQSAGQLATDTIQLDPIALYNVLFELRMHADVKGKRRGLLIELQPQQAPVIILEPFNIAVTNQVSKSRYVYQGKQAKLIRLWGRRRLSLLKRLLPYTDSVSVSLLGQGMPSYWTLTGKGFHFTFAMTGFSQSNWSQSLNFDLLLPKRPEHNHINALQPLLEQLQIEPSSLTKLSKVKGLAQATKKNELTSQLINATQQGLVRYDIATQTFYYRPLTQMPLDMAQFAHHNSAEKQAYDLISRKNAVQKFRVENIPTKGIVIQGDIEVSEDRRIYHSQLQLNDEGMVTKAECSCPQYLQHRLAQGVCAHIIALRLAYNSYDSHQASLHNLKNCGSWHETRVLSKRLSTKSASNSFIASASNSAKTTLKKSSDTKSSDINPLVMDLSALALLSEQSQNLKQSTAHQDDPLHDQSHDFEQDFQSNNARMAMVFITVEHKKVLIEQIIDDKTTRQQFVYNQPRQAFDAYQEQIARFEAKGFIENQGV